MSKMSKAVNEMAEESQLKLDESVQNFMGGKSYKLNPLDTLKMISASSIFGEAAYYRKDVKDGHFSWKKDFSDPLFEELLSSMDTKSTTEIFTEAIDNALAYDFGATLNFAVELRKKYYMRLNPQVIMVRASLHPKRAEWTASNPGKFAEIERQVMSRADEPMTQLTYYMYANKGNKAKIPTILKKSLAEKLSSLSKYEINKYKNHEIGMINAIRITHANSDAINELMQNGSVDVPEEQEIWEQRRSAGESWEDILKSGIKLGHMALLRNLRNIFTDVTDESLLNDVLKNLKAGVPDGKQFPFRYLNAYNRIKNDDRVRHKALLLDTLENCIDIAIGNMPKIKGKTMCLSDNSGSAWGTLNSEYGRVTIAEIDNLSSVLTAMLSEEGCVGKFGDGLIRYDISKRNGALVQSNEISKDRGYEVGHGTEGGIWKFFRDAIKNKEHWDNIVVYSDEQCGTGGLYGTSEDKSEYMAEYSTFGSCINVYKLILEYQKKVNPKCNFFCVQTAGYDNVLVPQNAYRCAFLTGWTGKEVMYMKQMNDFWDEIDNK